MTTWGAVYKEQYYLFRDQTGRELRDHQANRLLVSWKSRLKSEAEAKKMLESALERYYNS